MNLLPFFLKAFALAPQIWAGISFLHADASHETKLQLASNSLELATGVADAILPAGDQILANAASQGLRAILSAAVVAHQMAAAVQVPPTPAAAPTAAEVAAAAAQAAQ